MLTAGVWLATFQIMPCNLGMPIPSSGVQWRFSVEPKQNNSNVSLSVVPGTKSTLFHVITSDVFNQGDYDFTLTIRAQGSSYTNLEFRRDINLRILAPPGRNNHVKLITNWSHM